MTLLVDIHALRTAKGWTQAELAKRAGISRSAVIRIEQGGQRSIDLDVLDGLAKAFGIDPGLLLKREGKK